MPNSDQMEFMENENIGGQKYILRLFQKIKKIHLDYYMRLYLMIRN